MFRRLLVELFDVRFKDGILTYFSGEVKVVMRMEWTPDSAAVRMKGAAEDGSLWRVRSSNGELGTQVKAILDGL
jgi:hypothetical protein